MIQKGVLQKFYLREGKSFEEIAGEMNCSVHRISYWMKKHRIPTRTISEAVYLKNNPDGDPFCYKAPITKEQAILFGLGLGLYWGEGTKASQYAVRLGNSDPLLVRTFLRFMIDFFQVKKEDFRFSVQLFSDMDVKAIEEFWIKYLSISRNHLYKTTVTISGSLGTYRHKSKYGVITLHYNNKKLRECLEKEFVRVKLQYT